MVAGYAITTNSCTCPYCQGTGTCSTALYDNVTIYRRSYEQQTQTLQRFEESVRKQRYDAVARSRALATCRPEPPARPTMPARRRYCPRTVHLQRCPQRRPRLSLLRRVMAVVR